MAEREASGNFDYLFDDPTLLQEIDGDVDDLLDDPGDVPWDEPWDGPDDERDGFHPVNAATGFRPPTAWYRTRQVTAVLVAAATAVIAIVVSGVLLVFRSGPSGVDESTTVTPTAPSSAAPAPARSTSKPPSPAPPPPPPPPDSAEQINPEPTVDYRPTSQPRPAKKPEIGVTRTQETRSPISVAPRPRSAR